MSNMVIDSSVFVSSLGIEDDFTQITRQFFKLAPGTQFILPTLVIAEALTVLNRQQNTHLAEIAFYLQSYELIALDKSFLDYFVRELPPSNLKGADLVIAMTAKQQDASLVTWDKQLLHQKQAICKTFTPKEWLAQQKV